MSNGTTALTLGPPKETSVSAVLRELQEAVEERAGRDGWHPMLSVRINLVLEELALNVMSHGATPENPSPEMEIRITSREDEVALEFSDEGRPFNPLENGPEPAGEREISIGGMGLTLIRNTMDTMKYARSGGRNTLTMTVARG